MSGKHFLSGDMFDLDEPELMLFESMIVGYSLLPRGNIRYTCFNVLARCAELMSEIILGNVDIESLTFPSDNTKKEHMN